MRFLPSIPGYVLVLMLFLAGCMAAEGAPEVPGMRVDEAASTASERPVYLPTRPAGLKASEDSVAYYLEASLDGQDAPAEGEPAQ